MRFRLANNVGANQGGQQLASGIGSLFQGFAMAPMVRAQETEARLAAETTAAQNAERLRAESALRAAQEAAAQASARQSDAQATLFGEKAGEIKTQQNRGTLGELIKSAAMTRGIPQAMAPDLDYAINTGGLPQGKYQSPNAQAEFAHFLRTGAAMPGAPVDTTMGPSMPLPDALRPENIAKVMRDIGLMQNSLALGRGTIEDVAKAQDVFRSQDLGDDVLAGTRTAGSVGQAQAAMAGKALINNIGDSGEGFNQFTGERQRISDPLFTLFGNKANAQIGADNARAEASLAAANKTRRASTSPLANLGAPSGGGMSPADRSGAAAALGVPLADVDPYALLSPKAADKVRERTAGAMDKAFSERQDAVNAERMLAQEAAKFKELNARTTTGGATALPGVGAVRGAFDADFAEMRAISSRIVPKMREPGSGATSDFDARMFQNATIGPDKPREANNAIADAMIARAQMVGDKLEFDRAYADVNGHLRGADRAWRAYVEANPIFDPQAQQLGRITLNPNRVSYQQYFRGSVPAAPPAPKPAAALPPRNAKGWALQEDAKGNRAYVSPDGRQFEEVR